MKRGRMNCYFNDWAPEHLRLLPSLSPALSPYPNWTKCIVLLHNYLFWRFSFVPKVIIVAIIIGRRTAHPDYFRFYILVGAGLLIKAESSVPSLRFWTWEKENGKGRKGKIEGSRVRGRWRERMREGETEGVWREMCVYLEKQAVLSEENNDEERNTVMNKVGVLKVFKALIMIIFGMQTYSFL